MSEKEFADKMREVDCFCIVDFSVPGVPYAIRIRPSTPRLRNALIEQAKQYRVIGVLVSVVEEVDDWDCCIEKVPGIRESAWSTARCMLAEQLLSLVLSVYPAPYKGMFAHALDSFLKKIAKGK